MGVSYEIITLWCLLVIASHLSNAFHVHSPSQLIGNFKTQRATINSVLYAKKKKSTAAGKGFGTPLQPLAEDSVSASSDAVSGEDDGPMQATATDPASSPTDAKGNINLSEDEVIKSSKYFIESRRQKEAMLDEKIKNLREEEELLASDPSVGAVPELVADRMIKRIFVFFGVPVFGGLLIFVAAFFAAKKFDLTLPPYVVGSVTILPFALGLLGISYAIISSSWDEEDGSAFGVEEFKTNFKRIQDGLQRTSDREKLREDIEQESKKLGRK